MPVCGFFLKYFITAWKILKKLFAQEFLQRAGRHAAGAYLMAGGSNPMFDVSMTVYWITVQKINVYKIIVVDKQ